MAERRLPFAVQDDDGVERRGEVVIVAAWRDDVQPSPNAAFTIVLTQQPPSPDACVRGRRVALCAPATPTRLAASAGEARVAYSTNGEHDAPPVRLPRRAIDSYAKGAVLAARPLTITAQEVFAHGGQPRLELIARALLLATRDEGRYWEALDAVLSWPGGSSRLSRPNPLRVRLARLLKGEEPPANAIDAFDRLHAIARGGDPADHEPSAAGFAEDAALIRCLIEQPGAAGELIAFRAYMDAADPGVAERNLIVDHASTRERLSFVALLTEPHSGSGMRAGFEAFRSAYGRAYIHHHDAYARATAQLRSTLDEARPLTSALEKLNTLRPLGRPAGVSAMRAYERLDQRLAPCGRADLAGVLLDQPRCPECGLSLRDEPPREEAHDLLRRLRRALDRQQARLASETIRRILARGGERIDQFLQIIQASDQAGLARVLDGDLLAFLQDLLSQPVSITTDALSLIDGFVRAHPTIRNGDIDAAAETLRALLAERTSPDRPLRLAAPPS